MSYIFFSCRARKLLFFLFCFSMFAQLSAQNKFTISGSVKDKLSGESLIGASVKLEEKNIGALTNSYGFYSITAPQGNYTITVNYAGYQMRSQKIEPGFCIIG